MKSTQPSGSKRKLAGLPAHKYKNGSPHSVPLNEIAMSVLQKQLGKHPTHAFTFRGKING
jgi:hypothetical protein